jgi:toxin ParE1/3/4
MRIHIQVRARADLKSIWHYSRQQWGEEQAETYLRDIERTIGKIAENPEIGFSCSYVRNGYRQYSVKRHMIFYKILSDRISVVRVLHERMDYKTNLH